MNTTTTNRRFHARTATALLGIFSAITTTAFFGFLSTGIEQGVANRIASVQFVAPNPIIVGLA